MKEWIKSKTDGGAGAGGAGGAGTITTGRLPTTKRALSMAFSKAFSREREMAFSTRGSN